MASETPAIPPRTDEEKARNLPEPIPFQRIYVYNMDESETPGGLKVRVKIRVLTGPAATRLDARQTIAILELLRCAQRPRTRPAPH